METSQATLVLNYIYFRGIMNNQIDQKLTMSQRKIKMEKFINFCGEKFLLCITALSLITLLFIFFFIIKDALPFFQDQGFKEFFTSTHWYPSAAEPEYGAVSIFYGTFMVTLGSAVFAVPLGITAAVCLSDVLPFKLRQFVKPIIELLAAIPSVAYGFFALVILAPLMQNHGGLLLSSMIWLIMVPTAGIILYVGYFSLPDKILHKKPLALSLGLVGIAIAFFIIKAIADKLYGIQIDSGTNTLNVSLILGIMALPTIVSVAEDALQACGRELREGSYALGATRAETMVKTIIPAASGGIMAAIILGVMRAVGETMVVWMASGNTGRIPEPWYNVLSPVRTMTASIAGDMGEAARNTNRYHVLFALALTLLVLTFVINLISQYVVNRQRKKLGK